MTEMQGSADTGADLHKGHRERLRKKVMKGGTSSLYDYQVIEMLLHYCIPRKDTKSLAKTLLAQHKTVQHLIYAEQEGLLEIPGIGENVVVFFKLLQRLTRDMLHEALIDSNVLSSWQMVVQYCRNEIGFDREEKIAVLYLDSRNRLICSDILAAGTVNRVNVYTREVVREAVLRKAVSIILVHNHPSGDTTPSKQDIEMTRTIRDALRNVDILLHDHLIISPNSCSSFKTMGLL
ncbi:DNA repair protein RadC [Alphaproteobacteria bacterium LSUCC0684]